GGGGMIATNNLKQAEHIKFLVNQARDASRGYYHPEIGFNYRMTNLEAALGLAQFERLAGFLEKKGEFYQIYRQTFAGIDSVKEQEALGDTQTSAWLSSVTINTAKIGLSIPEIQEKLKTEGIPTRRIFPPITEFPPYRRYQKQSLDNCYSLYENGLNLPSSTVNTCEDIRRAADTLVKVVKKSGDARM
ncbi:MAG: DegT/DnrJ/EryC1/StrS family aminotransferase, partial [Bacillota bacterium]